MKKFLCISFVFIIAFNIPTITFAQDVEVKAKSAVLMSLDTKEVLYKFNEYEELSPASVTKMMSMLLIFEALESNAIKLNDKVKTSSNAASMGGSQIWLEVGEELKVEELLKSVIVASANDSCVALAEHVAGSTSAFVRLMNEKAKKLGLKHTSFENCTGLDDTTTNHYSCAYDLAVIACEVMKYENIVTKYSTIWLDSIRNGKTELNNTNKLVNKYNGITGLKTGTTSNAGFCIAATANRDGMRLVAVVLGSTTSEDRFSTATNLLDYGFANFETRKIKIDKKKIQPVKIKGGKQEFVTPIYNKKGTITSKKSDANNIEYKYKVKKEIKAPISKSDKLGDIEIIQNKKVVSSIPLLSPCDVDVADFWFVFCRLIRNI